MSVHAIDAVLMLSYFVLTFVWASRRGRRTEANEESTAPAAAGEAIQSGADYLLASRRLTLPAFVASMVASWYGGILGVGEYSFKYGLSNWLVFGVPYYLAAAVFALFLADRARKSEALTLPEQIRGAYGRGPGILASAIVFCTSVPAAYLVALSVLLHVVLGIPLLAAMLLSIGFAVLTIWRAGFKSVVRSNALQFVLMFLGFMLFLPVLFHQNGGLSFLTAHTPPSHWTWTGGRGAQAIIVWYFIALSALVEPLFYQRCFAARTPAVARTGLFLSILCWAFFDFMTTFTGLYARAILTDLPASRAAEAYPLLALRCLPAGLCGIFFISMAATVVSSLDGCLFVSASTLGRDLLGRTKRFEGKIPQATKLGLIISAIAAFALAWLSKSVVTLWHGLGSLSTTSLLLPVLGAFIPRLRMTHRGAVVHMCLAFAVTLIWLIALNAFKKQLLGIEPIFAGLAAGLLVWLCDRLFARIRPAPTSTDSDSSPQFTPTNTGDKT